MAKTTKISRRRFVASAVSTAAITSLPAHRFFAGVAEAANGKLAYDKLLAEPFDLVITDLEMPEMKGIELLDHAVHFNPQLLVVIITAYGSLETAIAALRKGASDYILKPIEVDELLLKVQRLLEHKNIVIGTKLEVKKHFDFDHSIELKIKSATITISEQLAKNIFVTYEPQS